jgi:hypothetical protein
MCRSGLISLAVEPAIPDAQAACHLNRAPRKVRLARLHLKSTGLAICLLAFVIRVAQTSPLSWVPRMVVVSMLDQNSEHGGFYRVRSTRFRWLAG